MVFARQKAAQAWRSGKTKSKKMDMELAEEFARIICKESYEPHLGCASTKELIDEIKARSDLSHKTIPDCTEEESNDPHSQEEV